jgi:hypothetical protein
MKNVYVLTVTFMDGTTKTRKFTNKREAEAAERHAISFRIVMFTNLTKEQA